MEIVSETSDSDGKFGEAALLSFALKVERAKEKIGRVNAPDHRGTVNRPTKVTWLQSTGGGGAGSVEVRTTLTCIVEEA